MGPASGAIDVLVYPWFVLNRVYVTQEPRHGTHKMNEYPYLYIYIYNKDIYIYIRIYIYICMCIYIYIYIVFSFNIYACCSISYVVCVYLLFVCSLCSVFSLLFSISIILCF